MSEKSEAQRSGFAQMALRLVLHRALWAALMLLVLSATGFALLELAPGDYLTGAALDPTLSEGATASLRQRYGLGQEWGTRYAMWLHGIARGNLGPSYAYGIDASALLLPRLRATLALNAAALLLALAIAVPVALYSASDTDRPIARVTDGIFQGALALPEIVVVLFLVAAAIRWGLPLPGGGEPLDSSNWSETLATMLVPCLALAIGAAPVFYRHVRGAVEQALAEPFVLSARQLGIGGLPLAFRYILPAAANPLISLLGVWVGGLLSASLVVETVTGWPGMGPLLLDAVLARDTHLVIGAVILAGTSLLAGNLVADLLLLRLDPRIRR